MNVMNEKHSKTKCVRGNLQSEVGLDTVVYLRTNEIKGFILFDELAYALHPPSVTFTRYPKGRRFRSRKESPSTVLAKDDFNVNL